MEDNFTYDWFDKVILLVEDEPICRLFFQSILRSTGVNVLYAHNGIEAISMVKKYPEINLVLMDIKLPLMNGIEATRQIKKIRPELQIVAQTAYALNNERQRVLEAGCDDYVSKPIRIEILMDKIEKVFITS